MSDREKIYLIIGSVFIVFLGILHFVITPFTNAYDRKKTYIETLYSNIDELNQLGTKYVQRKKKVVASGNLKEYIDNLITPMELTSKVKEVREGFVEVSVDGGSIADMRRIIYNIEEQGYFISSFELGASFEKKKMLTLDMTVLQVK